MIKYECLLEKPFFLSKGDIEWVKNTYKNMTLAEKVGQLFFLTGPATDKNFLKHITNDLKVGGLMCRAMEKEAVVEAVAYLQTNSKVPMLIAANLEAGGNGIVKQGTKIGSQMLLQRRMIQNYAYELGHICAVGGKKCRCKLCICPSG